MNIGKFHMKKELEKSEFYAIIRRVGICVSIIK
jgi:hypothetical protein